MLSKLTTTTVSLATNVSSSSSNNSAAPQQLGELANKSFAIVPHRRRRLVIAYADGACRANGQSHAIAGVGVWFANLNRSARLIDKVDGSQVIRFKTKAKKKAFAKSMLSTRVAHHLQISEVLPGARQTNQRAELWAAIRCLQTAPLHMPLRIISDSKYLVESMNMRRFGWTHNTFTTIANGDLLQILVNWINEREHHRAMQVQSLSSSTRWRPQEKNDEEEEDAMALQPDTSSEKTLPSPAAADTLNTSNHSDDDDNVADDDVDAVPVMTATHATATNALIAQLMPSPPPLPQILSAWTQFVHVYGHAGVLGNELSDQLANYGADKATRQREEGGGKASSSSLSPV